MSDARLSIFTVSAVFGALLAFPALRAANCNRKRWLAARKQPLIPDFARLDELPPAWIGREKHWPKPRFTPGDSSQRRKWETYSHIAKQQERTARATYELLSLISGAWLGYQLAPWAKAFWLSMNHHSQVQPLTSPYLDPVFWHTLLPIVPVVLLMMAAFGFRTYAEDCETIQEQYAAAARQSALRPSEGVPEIGLPKDGRQPSLILSVTLLLVWGAWRGSRNDRELSAPE